MTERARIAPVDEASARAARERIDALTKPVGSLGRIEELAVQLAAIAGRVPQRAYDRAAVIVGAGDHGVAEEGVSAYPQEVTPQMVGGFLAGHAAVNAFARSVGAAVFVADFGILHPFEPRPGLLSVSVRRGTRNFAREAALTGEEVDAALQAGADVFAAVMGDGPYDALALGDMGIANSTCAAAIVAAITGEAPANVVGRGTGVSDAGLAHKTAVVERALARFVARDWETVAREVGGLEILGLAGVMLAAAAARMPVVIDGVIVTAAALLACAIEPNVRGYLIASHLSVEPGHRIALTYLGLQPLLDLHLRLGEGTGATLALPFIEAATRMTCEMLTFAEAGVATKSE